MRSALLVVRLSVGVVVFLAHYHLERPHQGLGNRLITPRSAPVGGGDVVAGERLGGLLRYRRVA